MINILICSAIVLCFAVIAYGAIFINYEVSKEKEEAKKMNTNLQEELNKLKACCNNKRLDSIYISEDKNMSNCKRTMVVNLLRKIINNLYDLSDNHLVEYNDIERTINLAKTAESIIKN